MDTLPLSPGLCIYVFVYDNDNRKIIITADKSDDITTNIGHRDVVAVLTVDVDYVLLLG